MFKINNLILYDLNDNKYTYDFSCGVNYIRGSNSTGKTEFYKFIDYMFRIVQMMFSKNLGLKEHCNMLRWRYIEMEYHMSCIEQRILIKIIYIIMVKNLKRYLY